MGDTYGENIKLNIFGESHSEEIGMTLEGIPAGEVIDREELNAFMMRRAPGRNDYSTPRREKDIPIFKKGIAEAAGKQQDAKDIRKLTTDGTAITAVLKNEDIRPGDYEKFINIPRPGHADLTAAIKYGTETGVASGGGRFSGRMTAPLCIAGGICKQLLAKEGIEIISRIYSIRDIKDEGELTETTAPKPFPTVSEEQGNKMIALIKEYKDKGDSVGGVVECLCRGIPAGLGGPLFQGMESRISEIVFGIPAVKGIEFGAGFEAARLTGRENNDAFRYEEGRVVTETNNAGGILGGITNGMPLTMKVAFKPTPSIAVPQKSVDLETGENTELTVTGRHDPCVVPRAVPCVEAAVAIAIYDGLLGRRKELACEEETLETFREGIDEIDSELLKLFEDRMELSGKIAEYKKANNIPVLDEKREAEKLAAIEGQVADSNSDYAGRLYKLIFEMSRECQNKKR